MRLTESTRKSKPMDKEVGLISVELDRVRERNYGLLELRVGIEQGKTMVLDNYVSTRSPDNFIGTRYIGIDMDELDADFYETERLLRENGYDGYYIRYKSFSYTEEHQKHRYILAFDRLLNKTEVLTIYKHLQRFLNIDTQTVDNLCRLWYGTNKPIRQEDAPGVLLDANEILRKVVPSDIVVDEWELTANADMKYDFTIVNMEDEAFIERMREEISVWDYGNIRNGIYAACVIYELQMEDDTYIKTFISLLEPEYRNTWENYHQYDLKHKKVYYGSAMNILREYSWVVPNKINNIFDILEDCEEHVLEEGEFITTDDMLSLETGNNLMIAPAGSGKTTAIMELGKIDKSKKRVVVVPTIAICEQLHLKYGDQEDFEFLYSNPNGDDSISTVMSQFDANLTVCTYDSYVYNTMDNNTFGEHILYIDEAHEFIAFYGMKQKEAIINHILVNQPENCVYVTATPFNLADVFDRKLFFKKNTNKDTTVIVTDDVRASTYGQIVSNPNKKVLIYINSKAKIKRFVEYIETNMPDLKVDGISSTTRSGAYKELLHLQPGEEISYDVVITTKMLNIGFDINDKFDLVLYADEKVRANDLLQFFNRERQTAEFKVITKKKETTTSFNVNTRYRNYRNRMSRNLSHEDMYRLDNKFVDGVANPHIVTDKEFYNYVELGVKHIKQLFKIFYPNFDNDLVIEEKKPMYPESKTNTLKEFGMYVNMFDNPDDLNNEMTRIEGDFQAFMFGQEIDWRKDRSDLDSDFWGGSTIRKIYGLFNRLKYNLDKIEDLEIVELSDDGNYYKFNRGVDYYYRLSDRGLIYKFESELMQEELLAISNMSEIYPDDRDRLCNRLNVRSLLVDNKPWNEQNFKKRLERFNILLKPKRKRDEDGNQVRYLENVTLYIEDL